jgi:hypothetical protein
MPETPPAPSRPRRLRGAPLNNLNALKHGFYARKFRPTDLVDLAESKFIGLNEEITMLRVFMRGVIEQSSSASTLSESIEVLRVLSLAAASLTRFDLFRFVFSAEQIPHPCGCTSPLPFREGAGG